MEENMNNAEDIVMEEEPMAEEAKEQGERWQEAERGRGWRPGRRLRGRSRAR